MGKWHCQGSDYHQTVAESVQFDQNLGPINNLIHVTRQIKWTEVRDFDVNLDCQRNIWKGIHGEGKARPWPLLWTSGPCLWWWAWPLLSRIVNVKMTVSHRSIFKLNTPCNCLWYHHNIAIPHKAPLLIAPKAVGSTALVHGAADGHKWTTTCAKPNQGFWLAFTYAIQPTPQANSSQHVVVWSITHIECVSFHGCLQACCAEVSLPSTKLKEIMQAASMCGTRPELPAPDHKFCHDGL